MRWSFNAYTSFLAPPITYQIDGIQYVAILAGTGGGDLFGGESNNLASTTYGNFVKLLVFKLDGSAELPQPTALDRSIPEQPASDASAEDIARGDNVYHSNCAVCHGVLARSSGVVPDLRMTNATRHGLYNEIVLGGILAGTGMASFADLLDENDVEKVRAYVIQRANEDRAAAAAAAD